MEKVEEVDEVEKVGDGWRRLEKVVKLLEKIGDGRGGREGIGCREGKEGSGGRRRLEKV